MGGAALMATRAAPGMQLQFSILAMVQARTGERLPSVPPKLDSSRASCHSRPHGQAARSKAAAIVQVGAKPGLVSSIDASHSTDSPLRFRSARAQLSFIKLTKVKLLFESPTSQCG